MAAFFPLANLMRQIVDAERGRSDVSGRGPKRSRLRAALLATAVALLPLGYAEPADAPLERRFDEVVQPLLKNHCFACHGPEKQEGKLDLSGAGSVAAVVRNHQVWELVAERLEANEMPPETARRQLSPSDRKTLLAWLRDLR
jgi:mono/diheme cytochrome c family protein